jgi:hypothetical protein
MELTNEYLESIKRFKTRNINIYRINGFVAAYEKGKCLGYTYGLTDTMILDSLGIDPKTVDYTYKEYQLPEDMDQSFPQNEVMFDFLKQYRVL